MDLMSDTLTLEECLGQVCPSPRLHYYMQVVNIVCHIHTTVQNVFSGIYFAENSSKSNQYVYGIAGGNGCPTHKDKSCYICARLEGEGGTICRANDREVV